MGTCATKLSSLDDTEALDYSLYHLDRYHRRSRLPNPFKHVTRHAQRMRHASKASKEQNDTFKYDCNTLEAASTGSARVTLTRYTRSFVSEHTHVPLSDVESSGVAVYTSSNEESNSCVLLDNAERNDVNDFARDSFDNDPLLRHTELALGPVSSTLTLTSHEMTYDDDQIYGRAASDTTSYGMSLDSRFSIELKRDSSIYGSNGCSSPLKMRRTANDEAQGEIELQRSDSVSHLSDADTDVRPDFEKLRHLVRYEVHIFERIILCIHFFSLLSATVSCIIKPVIHGKRV